MEVGTRGGGGGLPGSLGTPWLWQEAPEPEGQVGPESHLTVEAVCPYLDEWDSVLQSQE